MVTTNNDIADSVAELQRQMASVQIDITGLKSDMREVKSITGQVDDIFVFTRQATKLFKWISTVVGGGGAIVVLLGIVQGWFS